MRGKKEKKREKIKERKEKEGKKKRVRQGGARWDVGGAIRVNGSCSCHVNV